MAGRRTNLALFALLAIAFTTGAVAFGIGTGWNRWAVTAHAIAGFAVVILSPWKSVIARRGLRRSRPGNRTSVALAALTGAALVFGLLHSTGIGRSFGGLTAMQVHVGAALIALPLAIWHILARRVRVHHSDASRRQLLRTGALAGGATLAYLGVEGVARLIGLPGEDRRFTGSFERGSGNPEEMPVTQWLNDRVPEIDLARWRLQVRSPKGVISISYEDLRGYDDRIRAVLDCTGGWFAEQEWAGVRFDRLLRYSGLTAAGLSIGVKSATGYSRRFPIADSENLLLATRVGGVPLSAGHGRPVRVVAPGRRGFWWVKWVTEIAISDVPWWRQPPFPLT